MVYLALGIFAVSVTLYVYKSCRPGWLRQGSELTPDHTLKTPTINADNKYNDQTKPDTAKLLRGSGERLRLPRDGSQSSPSGYLGRGGDLLPMSPQTTPKASPQHAHEGAISLLTLDGAIDEGSLHSLPQVEDKGGHNHPSSRNTVLTGRPSQPSPGSMPPPSQSSSPSLRKPISPSSNLMPPPSRPPTTSNHAPSKPSSTLLPPPSTASTLRKPLPAH